LRLRRKKTTTPAPSWGTGFPRPLALQAIHAVSEKFLHPCTGENAHAAACQVILVGSPAGVCGNQVPARSPFWWSVWFFGYTKKNTHPTRMGWHAPAGMSCPFANGACRMVTPATPCGEPEWYQVKPVEEYATIGLSLLGTQTGKIQVKF
jgi:hypothetical protein